MIVVFLTHNYPRFPGDLPGSFLHPLAQALQRRGHDVRVVAPADRGKGGRDLLDGIPVRRVRYASPGAETLAYTGRMQQAMRSPAGWLALWGLLRAMRAGVRAELLPLGPSARPPVVVHAHWWLPAGLASPPELPGVVTLHGTDGRILIRNPITRWLGARVLRRAAVVTAVSPELARTAEGISGRTGVTGHVQPMPVETAGWPWSRGGGGLLLVGRLTGQKRVHLAIQAASALAAGGLRRPLTIIGDGPERRALERESAGNPGIEVRLLGSRSRPEVIAQLETADVLLFPAEQEGFGLAAIEALMMGIPVVACTDGGGIVSALERFGGGLIADPTAQGLAEAIRSAESADCTGTGPHCGDPLEGGVGSRSGGPTIRRMVCRGPGSIAGGGGGCRRSRESRSSDSSSVTWFATGRTSAPSRSCGGSRSRWWCSVSSLCS